jgi:hypothetical protein
LDVAQAKSVLLRHVPVRRRSFGIGGASKVNAWRNDIEEDCAAYEAAARESFEAWKAGGGLDPNGFRKEV